MVFKHEDIQIKSKQVDALSEPRHSQETAVSPQGDQSHRCWPPRSPGTQQRERNLSKPAVASSTVRSLFNSCNTREKASGKLSAI